MSSQLVGAWEGGREGMRLFLVFTETHYCHFGAAEDRQPFQGEQPTEAEAAEAFRTMVGGAGTYTLSGSTLIVNQEFGRIPRPQTTMRWEEVNIEDDTLAFNSPHGNRIVMRKVS